MMTTRAFSYVHFVKSNHLNKKSPMRNDLWYVFGDDGDLFSMGVWVDLVTQDSASEWNEIRS